MNTDKYEMELEKLKEHGMEEVKSCEQCSHLMHINKNGVFAVCKLTSYVFMLWQVDTRSTTCPCWEGK